MYDQHLNNYVGMHPVGTIDNGIVMILNHTSFAPLLHYIIVDLCICFISPNIENFAEMEIFITAIFLLLWI